MQWKEFTMPAKFEFEPETLTPQYGKLIVEPFERGYAITVANALRRALISSIEGTAPVSIKVEGVPHEFGTIPGVTEDVMDIILNVRQMKLRMHGTPPKTLRLDITGVKTVTAKDFEPNPEVEMLNPDLHIATLTEKEAHLALELEVDMGRGFVPAERNKRPDAPIGVIPLDSNFSPVVRVRYDVENTRVGQVTDFERLILELWTDGRVSPEKAVDQAAFIVKEHFSIMVKEGGEDGEGQQTKETERLRELVNRGLEDLELSVRAMNSLHNENIKTIGDLVKLTDEDLLKLKNFGHKSLEEIKTALGAVGLTLGMDVSAYVKVEQS